MPRPAFFTHPQLRRASPLSLYIAGVGLEACAAVREKCPDARIGLLLCFQTGPVQHACRFFEEALRDPATASPMLFPETVFTAPASHLAALLNIVNNLRHGIHITDSSCSIINSNLYNNLIDSVFPTNSDITAENNFWGSKLGPVFSKGFLLADTPSKDFGKIRFFPWKTTEYQNVGSDWVVEKTFEKTIIHGYGDPQLDLPGDDADNDGAPNWWEKQFGYNETNWNDHRNIDPDGDGLNNIEECYAYSWGAISVSKRYISRI